MRRRSLAILAFLALSASPISTKISADDKLSPIENTYPVGSVTYLFTCVAPPDDWPAMGEMHPATMENVENAMKLLLALESTDGKKCEPPVYPFQLTMTVWSDGTLECGSIERATPRSLEFLRNRLQRTEEEAKRAKKPLTTPDVKVPTKQPGKPSKLERMKNAVRTPSSTAGSPAKIQCHAKCDSGNRCSRRASENSLFCWQHKDRQQDDYPND